eukprot:PhF_6_TR28996/c0_g1_i1/m.42256/K10419/DYNLRB, DNCL2; dynein light chain roadblock-type
MTDNNIEELIKKINSHDGVKGFIIVNHEGIPIRHSFDDSRLLAIQYAALIQQLTQRARSSLREIDNLNELYFMRLRSKKHEILVAPDREYILIVIQQPPL